jgi:hypothetical protein
VIGFVKKHAIGIILFLVCCASAHPLILTKEYYLGKLEAYRDISRGMYKGRRCDYQCIWLPGTREYERLLEQMNFTIETTSACGPRMRGYNEVQAARLEHIYGADVFDRTLTQAINKFRNQP